MRGALVLTAVVLAGLAGGCGGEATATHRFFTGGGGVSCELAAGVAGLGTLAYCVAGPEQAVSVEMGESGNLTVCRGVQCLSNAPEDATALAPGESIDAGPFVCTSSRTGVRCLVARLGVGFAIGPDGVTRI